jgi:hypothetical protein
MFSFSMAAAMRGLATAIDWSLFNEFAVNFFLKSSCASFFFPGLLVTLPLQLLLQQLLERALDKSQILRWFRLSYHGFVSTCPGCNAL